MPVMKDRDGPLFLCATAYGRASRSMRKILRIIDSVNEWAGSISSWLLLGLIFVILWEVIARYVFNQPTTWGFNSFRMISGALIVFGWAYAQRHNSHIRVDILYVRFSSRRKALIDVIGTGLLFLPLFGTFVVLAGRQVVRTYLFYMAHYQGSIPTNLMYSTIILIGISLFFLQFLTRFVRDLHILVKGEPQ
jgi:TRAP-type mannitol/chloroaromatic compound transport system permease small subunit